MYRYRSSHKTNNEETNQKKVEQHSNKNEIKNKESSYPQRNVGYYSIKQSKSKEPQEKTQIVSSSYKNVSTIEIKDTKKDSVKKPDYKSTRASPPLQQETSNKYSSIKTNQNSAQSVRPEPVKKYSFINSNQNSSQTTKIEPAKNYSYYKTNQKPEQPVKTESVKNYSYYKTNQNPAYSTKTELNQQKIIHILKIIKIQQNQ